MIRASVGLMRRALVAVPLAVLLAAVATGCRPSSASPGAGRFVVAATVAPLADIVRQVVGSRASVEGLIPEGVDSHTFEPSPATIRSLVHADVLFMDGLHLEGSTLSQAKANMAKGSTIVRLGDLTLHPDQYAYDFTFPKEKGDPNPHLWMDPAFAERWSEIIRDTMVARDPQHASFYRANQAAFASAVGRLDAAISQAVSTIAPGHRKLLTYHDSFAYFARHYGMEVIGAVQPSDFSEPSAKEVSDLISQVRAVGVPAVFGSEVFPSTVLRQVASATGAAYVDKLRDDELPGQPGAANHTYLGLMVDDVEVITSALGGDPGALRSVPTTRTWS